MQARLLLFLVALQQSSAQLTAVITPRGYNASLDPEASFTFQCDVTGSDNIQWLVDGEHSAAQGIRDRGINESITTVAEATDSFRSSLFILRSTTNRNTTIRCQVAVISPTGDVSGVLSEPVPFKIQGLLDALPYSGKLSREKIFTNFAIFQPSAKVFSTKF